MRYLILGPLEVRAVNGVVPLGSPKQRRLLAALIARRGSSVSPDVLAEAIWDGAPPRTAAKTLQGYVVHVRHALANGASTSPIVTTSAGYAFHPASADEVDADRFDQLSMLGRKASERGDVATARVLFEEALGLWRGPAFADFADDEFARPESRRLEELRLLVLESRIDADLAAGMGAELVPELERLVAEHVTREHLWAQLVHALYRAGRQADALAAYRRARTVLRDELGIDPGGDLQALHTAVLTQDPVLEAVPLGEGPALPPGFPVTGPAFEGRDDDMSWLRDHWRSAVGGRGAVVVLTGPESVGKSRLLAEFGLEVHRRGGLISYDANVRAPSPASLIASAAGRPLLALLDEPVTAIAPTSVADSALLVVVALDSRRAPRHVRAGFLEAEHRELDSLSDEACGRIVDRYLDRGRGTIDIDQVLLRSAGLPGALHELVATAVEDRAVARIGSATQTATAVRASLAMARNNLRDGIVELRRGRSQHRGHANGGVVGLYRCDECPYKGLAQFEREDAALFHGRDETIATVLARVADTSVVALIGASGSGKSSLVRAGLLASLADGSLPGSSGWTQYVVRPGDPLPAPDDQALVLVVDQFEEVWTALDASSGATFVDSVMAVAEAGHRVVVCVRADYLSRCAEHAGLASVVAEGTVLIGPMTESEIRASVLQPASAVGLSVDPRLVEQVVKDVQAQPGALPMMSAALADTWERRSGNRLTMSAYSRSGGVSGSIARMAEATYASMSTAEQEAGRRLLLRLASTGEDGQYVRRRVSLPELERSDEASRALALLVAQRLLTIANGTVEVSHEALLVAWPRLSTWLDEDEHGRALRQHLTPAALDWAAAQRPTADLYRGLRLEAVREWASEHPRELTPLEHEFVDASLAESQRELRDQRERAEREATGRRRLRSVSLILTLTLVAAVVAAVVALDQRENAEDVARQAVSKQLGAAALVEDDLDRALLLAVAAVRMEDSPDTRSALLAVLQRSPAALQVVRPEADRRLTLEVSTVGDTIIIGDSGGGIARLTTGPDPASEAAVTAAPHGIAVMAARPGTTEIVLASLRATGVQLPRLIRWDWASNRRIGTPLRGVGRIPYTAVSALSWSDNGRWLAANQDEGDVLVWDFDHPGLPPERIQTNHERFRALAYAGAGRFVLVEESGEAAVWLPGATKPIVRFDVGSDVTTATSTGDGSRLAIGHEDGTVAMWDRVTGRLVQTLISHSSAIGAITFNRAGTSVATFGDDGEAIVSDTESGAARAILSGHSGPVTDGVFSADGTTLYTSSMDGSVMAWDLTGELALGARFSGAARAGWSWASISGEVVAVPDTAGRVRFWSATTRQPVGSRIRGDQKAIIHGAFSPDGAVYATAAAGGTVQWWNTSSATPGLVVRGLPGDANTIEFSPDGNYLAVCVWRSGGGTVHVLDAGTGEQVGDTIDVGWGITQLAWSPDSSRFAVASWEVPDFRVYDAGTHEVLWSQVAAADSSRSVAWSPDGDRLATGDESGSLRFWDAVTGEPIGSPLPGHAGPITTTTFSPDGTLVVTAGEDGRAILRDTATGHQLGAAIVASDGRYTVADFTSNAEVFVASDNGSMWLWRVDLASWLQRACTVAGRDLSPEEWAELDTGFDYQQTCP